MEKQVNIPAPQWVTTQTDASKIHGRSLVMRVSCPAFGGKGRSLNRKGKAIRECMVPRKRLETILLSPYRKPTQVLGHKCAKADERNIVQELGKKVAVTSG
jgi:hypothetical protein